MKKATAGRQRVSMKLYRGLVSTAAVPRNKVTDTDSSLRDKLALLKATKLRLEAKFPSFRVAG